MYNYEINSIGNNWTPTQHNAMIDCLKDLVTSSEQTLVATDAPDISGQLSIAAATYAHGSNVYTDDGAANAHSLSVKHSFKTPEAYFDGMMVLYLAKYANTGATTVNVEGKGIVNIYYDGAALEADVITADEIVELMYDETNTRFNLLRSGGSVSIGSSDGQGMSIEVTQVAHGLSAQQVVRRISGSYVPAIGVGISGDVIGVISEVASTDVFNLCIGGLESNNVWVDGAAYFLSPDVAGLALSSEPSYDAGDIRVFLGTGTADGLIIEVDAGDEIISESLESPLTTKGDLLGFDTEDVRIPVGTNGQVLVADSTDDKGAKWKEGIKAADETFTVGSSTGTYATIALVQAEINKWAWVPGSAPTISLVDNEIYEIDETIYMNVEGMTLLGKQSSTTLTSVDSSTGSAGNWTITMTLVDGSDVFVGSVISVVPTGTGTYKNFGGPYRVLTKPSTNVVTLKCTAETATVGTTTDVTGGTVTKFLTPISQTTTTKDIIESKVSSCTLDKIAGYGASGSNGVYSQEGTGIACDNICAMTENQYNYYIWGGGAIFAESVTAGNAVSNNYHCVTGDMYIPSSIGNHAAASNYYCLNGNMYADTSTANNAGAANYYCLNGNMYAISSTANNAGDNNYFCANGMLYARYGAANNATNSNYFARGGSIDARDTTHTGGGYYDFTVSGGGVIIIIGTQTGYTYNTSAVDVFDGGRGLISNQ